MDNTMKYYRVCTSKGRIVILGRIVSASGQIFRPDFRPQDEIIRPGMAFRPIDEQALTSSVPKQNILFINWELYIVQLTIRSLNCDRNGRLWCSPPSLRRRREGTRPRPQKTMSTHSRKSSRPPAWRTTRPMSSCEPVNNNYQLSAF